MFRANKTLLDLKVTTDPPPQFGRLGTTGAAVRGGPVAPGTCRYGLYSCSFKLTSHEDGDMGEDSSPAGGPDFDNGSDSDQVAVPVGKEKGVTVANSLDEALERLKDTDIRSRAKPNTTVPRKRYSCTCRFELTVILCSCRQFLRSHRPH